MELLKKNILLCEGAGGAGGNSIDIEQKTVNTTAEAIITQKENLQSAFNAANDAVTTALAAFDEGDSNKARLKTVLTNGTSDISAAITTINEFATKMTESSSEWTKAEHEIADALAAAFGGSGN